MPKPDAAPTAARPIEPPPLSSQPPAPGPGTEFSLAALKEVWPQLVEAVKAEKRLLGVALGDTVLAEVVPPIVRVTLKEANQMQAETLERMRDVVERHIAQRVAAPVKLEVRAPEAVGGPGTARPKRRTDASDRAERLQQLRAKDPALDAAAEALDLELTD